MSYVYYIGLLLLIIPITICSICYDFRNFTGQHAFLQFIPINVNISTTVYYSIEFWTQNSNGILLYAQGPHDYEILYITDHGILNYLLFNPSPSGIHGTIGSFHESKLPVNNATWLKVEIFRNWLEDDTENQVLKTGITLTDINANTVENHIDYFVRDGVVLDQKVYIGGISRNTIPGRKNENMQFIGKIRNLSVSDENTTYHFTHYNVNNNQLLRQCD